MLRTGTYLLESIFSGVFLWLGLYLITRDNPGDGQGARRWWQRPALPAGVAHVCVAWYLLGVAMQVIIEDPRKLVLWLRLTWWTTPLACSAIFHAVFLLTSDEVRFPRARRAGYLVSALLFGCAACVAVAGMTTGLFYQFEAVRRVPRAPHYLEIPPRYPFYALAVIFIVGALLATAIMPLWRYFALRGSARGQFRWIGAAAGVQALGAITGITGLSFPNLNLPPELGDAILVIGLALLGYGIAQHNALFQHQVITRDFYRSLAGVVVAGGTFVLVFAGVHRVFSSALTPESIPLLIWLAILTVTLRPWVGIRLDRIFLTPKTAAIREEVNRVSNNLVTAEDPQQAVRAMEHEMPERIKAVALEVDLRDLHEEIKRDIAKLLSGTNYKRPDSDDIIARETRLLDLTIVEDAATNLMKKDGRSPAFGRDYYRLQALRQIIRDLVEDIGADVPRTDVKSNEYRNRRGGYLILRQQFINGVPRREVEQRVHNELRIAPGGSYGRLLNHAKTELARRLYREEHLAREARERTQQRGARSMVSPAPPARSPS